MPNYVSVGEHKDFVKAKFEEDVAEGLMDRMTLGEFKANMYMHSPPYLYRFCVQETLAVKSETSQRQLVRAGVKVTGKVFMVAERKVAPGP